MPLLHPSSCQSTWMQKLKCHTHTKYFSLTGFELITTTKSNSNKKVMKIYEALGNKLGNSYLIWEDISIFGWIVWHNIINKHIGKIITGFKNYPNSDHISEAEPGGKNLRQDRTREVTVSKCLCLNLHPSGPVFLYQGQEQQNGR